jgi:hypothetical protein
MNPEIIELPLFDLKRQTILSVKYHTLELYYNHLVKKCDFFAEEPNSDDESMPWEERRNYFETLVAKKSIAGIEKSFSPSGNVYRIDIMIDGFNDDLTAYFKPSMKKEMNDCFEKLARWWLS